jgi:membrane protein DedA with SNARE-associated domain
MSAMALFYVGIFIAAAVEGEMVFVAASVSVALGRLDFWGVLIAGALGGSTGDQFFFYAFRGPFKDLLDKYPRLARKRRAVGRLVESYSIPPSLQRARRPRSPDGCSRPSACAARLAGRLPFSG